MSGLVMRNVWIGGRRTSLRLEGAVWDALSDVAGREGLSLNELCTRIHAEKRPAVSLASAIRVHVLTYFRNGAVRDTAELRRLA